MMRHDPNSAEASAILNAMVGKTIKGITVTSYFSLFVEMQDGTRVTIDADFSHPDDVEPSLIIAGFGAI